MDYIPGLAIQTRLFAYFFAFGFILGLLYDLLRVLRALAFPPRKSLLIFDALFGSLAAFLTFICLLVLNRGRVQAFILLAQALGALVYIFSLGGAMARFRTALLKAKNKAIETAVRPAKFLFGKIKALDAKIYAAIKCFLRKIGDYVKNRLHSNAALLYNNPVLSGAETQMPKGKGEVFRAKAKKSRQARAGKKTAQPSADNSGGNFDVRARSPDIDPDRSIRFSKKADSRKGNRGGGAAEGKRKMRGRAAPDRGGP